MNSSKIKVISLIILATAALVTTLPPLSYKTGNLFFGYSPYTYNVGVAQFFFKRAVPPLHSSLSPAPPFAHYQLSRTYFIQGNFNKSIEYANKELALYPENCRTYYIRGLTYGYMNDLDNAIQDFETFNATCVKDSWAGHNDLAWFYFRKGDIKKMRSTIEKIVDKNWTNPWVQNAYGIALLNDGERRLAHEAFTRALTSANRMTERDWGIAYPGNNPEIYREGLQAMRDAIQKNIDLTK